METRTRIAPSPTGPLHIGIARTALFNWLFAKKNKGRFILRIEDTDRERSRPEFEKDIESGLRWLGIDWDEFYRQSERADVYKGYIKKLLSSGRAYVSKEETSGPSGTTARRGEVIRFKNSKRLVSFEDLIRGKIEFDTAPLGDFVIAKSEDEALYHLAAVVDDFEMKISHVIRGEDHISNTPRQILIQEALGLPRPQYAHLPLILGPDRTKLSKRHGREAIREYREAGYFPDALINFIALLGWHPQDEREIFSKEDLTREFSLKRVQKGGAIFDIEKLGWLNREYLRNLSDGDFAKMLLEYLPDDYKKVWESAVLTDSKKVRALASFKERVVKLSDFVKENKFLFELPDYPKELLLWKDSSLSGAKKHLEKIYEIISNVRHSVSDIESLVMSYAEKEGRGEVLWPLRVALSGQKNSPGPFEIMAVLGKKESLARIKKAEGLLT